VDILACPLLVTASEEAAADGDLREIDESREDSICCRRLLVSIDMPTAVKQSPDHSR